MGHRRDGERKHIVDGVVGVSRIAQGSQHKVEADGAGEKEAQAVGVGKTLCTQEVQELYGRIVSLPALKVVHHKRKLVPQHKDEPVVSNTDQIVESLS